MSSVGITIKNARLLRGWDQKELAKRLGVGQQTVSGWERGTSRPRKADRAKLEDVLEVRLDDQEKKNTNEIVPRPLTARLPLANISPDSFERFVCDLFDAEWSPKKVSLYGSTGDKQDGIDIWALNENGTVYATIQCKREAQFGPAKLLMAIAEVSLPAERHILALARSASPAIRNEVKKHRGWDIFDIDDISRKLRSIEKGIAVRIVDTYFPGNRYPFLGVREAGPWITPAEAFKVKGTSGKIFSHDWDLVGRQEIVDEVVSFVYGEALCGTVIGRGGIGKTRLLKEICERIPTSWQINVLSDTNEPTYEQYELLPNTVSSLVIIDDAHDRFDLPNLLRGIWVRNPKTKVILSLRQYGMPQLESAFRKIGNHEQNRPTWTLKDLSISEARSLMAQILGCSQETNLIKKLAAIAADCPLLGVVGASLAKDGEIDPNALEGDDNIHNILREFQDFLIAGSPENEKELRRKALEGIAALQPFQFKDQQFMASLEVLTGHSADELFKEIERLKDCGVLMQRGVSLRIVPDLLGDTILSEACYRQKLEVVTGFINKAIDSAKDKALQNVLVNVSRVEWQIRLRDGRSVSLADSLWGILSEEFRDGDIQHRKSLLPVFEKVAYFQPGKALELVELAIKEPTNEYDENDYLNKMYPPKYEDVLDGLSPILKLIAYNWEFTPRALDMLWELAKASQRNGSSNSENPMKTLRELAEYGAEKPGVYNQLVLDKCTRWLQEQEDCSEPSPLDVMERLLATEGYDTNSDGITVSFHPYVWRAEFARKFRKKVLEVCVSEMLSGDRKRALKAASTFCKGLHYPGGLFGLRTSDEDLDSWTAVFVDELKMLRPVAQSKELDVMVEIALRKELSWHVEYSTTETKKVAKSLLKEFPKDETRELALLLYDGWGEFAFGKSRDSFETLEAKRNLKMAQTAEKLLKRFDHLSLINLIDQTLEGFSILTDGRAHPGPLMGGLVKQDQEFGIHFCRHIKKSKTSELVKVLSVVLNVLLETNRENLEVVEQLLATGNEQITQACAQSLSWRGRNPSGFSKAEMTIIKGFGTHSTSSVRASAIYAAESVAPIDPAQAVEILECVQLGGNDPLLKTFFGLFSKHGPLDWNGLQLPFMRRSLELLCTTDSIEDYHITSFLMEVAKSDPSLVVDLLLSRAEREDQLSEELAKSEKYIRNTYDATPHSWGKLTNIQSSSERMKLLKRIISWLQTNESWTCRKSGASVFRLLAGSFDDEIIGFLTEVLDSGDPSKFSVLCQILWEAPKQVIWARVDFVSKALHTGKSVGDEALKEIRGSLHTAAVSGMRSGSPTEPFPQDIELRDNAAKVIPTLPFGSIERSFYESVEKYALENINRHSIEYEDRFDGRDWS